MLFRRRVIGSINIKDIAVVTCVSKVYNGQTQVATNISVTFKGETLTENVDYTVVENTGGINVGSYTVKVKGIKKYSGEVQGLFSIIKVTPTVTIPTPRTSLIYNGNAQALIVAGSTDFGTLKYSLDDSTYSTSIPSGTNATSYTVYYKVEGDSNINDVPAQSISVSIAKANQAAPTATGASVTYGNTATATASGGGGQGSLEWSNGNTLTSNVGSKTTSARWSGNGNYNASSWSNEVTLSITRANRTLSWTTAPSSVEIETTATLLATPSAGSGDGSITYTSSNSNVATINGNTVSGRTTGSCTITATIAQGTNYNSASTSYTLNVTAVNYANHYLTFRATESGTFKFSGATGNDYISYSTNNGSSWTTLASNTDSPTVSAGSKIMWKATLTPISSGLDSGIGIFSSTGRFTVEGNPMSLLYGDNFVGQTDLTGKDCAFYNLFSGCTGMTSAENLSLPATTMAVSACSSMFSGCTSLTTAPELPATTLANNCYSRMFKGCTSLTTAPELPATTLEFGCYQTMFTDCTSLTTAPELPATTLARSCYSDMFNGCTSLTVAPELPATTLQQYCYSTMFEGCTSLTTAPVLSATTLSGSCYSSMFRGCTSLTTAPVLSATTLATSAYTYMFAGCTSLTTVPSNYLPVTTLANGCYGYMFSGCTSLTTAPTLPATTLASKCYWYMFKGCRSLNYIKAMFTTSPSTSYISNWVNGVASSGTFVKNSAATWTSNCGVSTYPCNWTVQTASS